jgi:crotonobetainyl-CoA:carnitine CoA-transferase CaiB-like acyl-CoA transferase
LSEPDVPAGPLTGLRVVELASGTAAHAGKLLADFGAEVLLIEPPGGHPSRRLGPPADELAATHGDRSLWFWQANTSKLGIELDLDDPHGATQFRRLVAHADVVLEAEPVGRLAALQLDHAQLGAAGAPGERAVWVSVTPFGRDDPRSSEPSTDLTVVAGGGIAWSNGYDDHSLPPMSSRGHQGHQTASIWAAVAALVALRARDRSGRGQLVDVSMHAAANVTTEQATHWWLVSGKVVQRQTGRHASHLPTESVITSDRDGREVHTGFPPRTGAEVAHLVQWIDDLGLRDELPLTVLLEMAIEQGGIDLSKLHDDEFTQECYRAARDSIAMIASKLTSQEFFIDGQTRGFAVGPIMAPDEVMVDEHLVARGFPTPVHQQQLGRDVIHPGLPIRFVGTPGRIRPAPLPRQHQHVLDELATLDTKASST